jgi:hypothetical protein
MLFYDCTVMTRKKSFFNRLPDVGKECKLDVNSLSPLQIDPMSRSNIRIWDAWLAYFEHDWVNWLSISTLKSQLGRILMFFFNEENQLYTKCVDCVFNSVYPVRRGSLLRNRSCILRPFC